MVGKTVATATGSTRRSEAATGARKRTDEIKKRATRGGEPERYKLWLTLWMVISLWQTWRPAATRQHLHYAYALSHGR